MVRSAGSEGSTVVVASWGMGEQKPEELAEVGQLQWGRVAVASEVDDCVEMCLGGSKQARVGMGAVEGGLREDFFLEFK